MSSDKMDTDETKVAAVASASADNVDGEETEEEEELPPKKAESTEQPPPNSSTATNEDASAKKPPPEHESNPPATAPSSSSSSSSSSRPSKKRPRSPSDTADAATVSAPTTTPSTTAASSSNTSQQQQAAVSAASAAAAAQISATMGWNGLYSLLSASVTTNASSASGSNSNNLPTVEQVQQAATKSVQDCPPFCHLSKTDSAPQLKVSLEDRRLLVKGGMRGYRMARATHGVSSGNYYYEAWIMDPPPVSEIVAALPPNIRMGKKLQESMQQALLEEQEDLPRTSTFGGHVRLGWSMRTGDLQAPVGYDKWSFGFRDIGGSKVHCSKREDNWGGESFGPGDVVGCAISLPPKDDPSGGVNHIRFFKNGMPMGEFIISKGKREGGAAFSPIPDGVYYPAISLYMAAVVKMNPGPHFVYQPRKLPTGMKIQPFSDLCKPPISVEDAVNKVQKEKTFRKADMLQKFQELVKAEVQVLQDSYQNHRRKHVQEVFKEREKRKLSTSDLEEDQFFEKPSAS